MKEDESNWFSRWEEQLPSPEELMPLSQTLITPHLALVFDLHHNINGNGSHSTPPPVPTPSSLAHPSSSEFENSGDLGSGGAGGGDEPARTLKRPRLVWTPQLHKRFVDAVAHLGIKNAVPKTIMQLMSVDGLTRENVASHLQKYRLYLKRMQGHSNGAGLASSDPATDHLFASSPVPPHFLHPAARPGPGQDHFVPFVAAPHQPGRPMWVTHPQLQQHRQVAHFGSPTNNNGQLEHSFMARQAQQPVHRMVAPPPYGEDFDSGVENGGRKVLTLFPTGDD